MEARDDIVEGFPFNPGKERVVLIRHSLFEVRESFSLHNRIGIRQLADQLHDNRVFVRINALADMIFNFQRPVVLQKERRKIALEYLRGSLVGCWGKPREGAPERELVRIRV